MLGEESKVSQMEVKTYPHISTAELPLPFTFSIKV